MPKVNNINTTVNIVFLLNIFPILSILSKQISCIRNEIILQNYEMSALIVSLIIMIFSIKNTRKQLNISLDIRKKEAILNNTYRYLYILVFSFIFVPLFK